MRKYNTPNIQLEDTAWWFLENHSDLEGVCLLWTSERKLETVPFAEAVKEMIYEHIERLING